VALSATPESAANLDRREVVAQLLAERADALLITGLGSTTWDAAAVGDKAENFYVWGGMGGAAMIGLGLALAKPERRVLVITGDGEMLMGLGAFATIAVQRPRNLAVVVIDNEVYGETGMQHTHTHFGVDLAGMATAAGFESARTVYTQSDLDTLCASLYEAPGPLFADVKVSTERHETVLPPRDGTYLKHRFRRAVLGDAESGSLARRKL
jgi:thiamine pyrophosphate-dependent acetolactate synthase large subunit-like protein